MTARDRGFPENNFQHWLNNARIDGDLEVSGEITQNGEPLSGGSQPFVRVEVPFTFADYTDPVVPTTVYEPDDGDVLLPFSYFSAPVGFDAGASGSLIGQGGSVGSPIMAASLSENSDYATGAFDLQDGNSTLLLDGTPLQLVLSDSNGDPVEPTEGEGSLVMFIAKSA